MSKPSSLEVLFREFLTLYPFHFGALFLVLLSEGAMAAMSILAVVPLDDFLLDASLEAPSLAPRFCVIIRSG